MDKELEKLIKKEFLKNVVKSNEKIPLIIPSYGATEIIEALDSLLTTKVTMGKKVFEFERLFSGYIGVKNGMMVNSGSSANLVALSVLSNRAFKNNIKPGDEIITPAVTWSTTVFPIINVGAIPVIVDVGEDYLIDIDKINEMIGPRTKAIMPVHLLGNPCEMTAIMELAEDHDLFVIEDCCEAHGAEYKNKKVGSFGDISTYSFFFSHHITTIEGGIVLTDNDELADLARITRAHGWVRDTVKKEEFAAKYPHIDHRFLFINTGYNFRPTEIQGAFGIHQINKLEGFVEIRRKNAEYWKKELSAYDDIFVIPYEKPGTRHAWFGFPLTIKEGVKFTRQQITQFLEKEGVETRPIMAGNISEQPAMKLFNHRKGELKNAEHIMKNSFFIGVHQGVGEVARKKLVDLIQTFIQGF